MIYHYTDLNAAKSITENAQIWLTDYRYLNDKEEFLKGFSVLCDALEEYDNYSAEYPDEFKENIKEFLEFIRTENHSVLERSCIFVSSYSKTPNLLSQWRSYGMYSLELDEAFLDYDHDDVYLLDCHYVYHLGDAKEYAEHIIEGNILPKLIKQWDDNNKWIIGLELMSLIEIYALSFKHEAFNDEDEIRLVISCSADDPRIQFRVKGELLIPYIPIKYDPKILKSITIGPIDNQELACDSLNMFANQISRRIQMDEMNFEYNLGVECSDIPYRKI
ncbi:hypothetical protein ACIP8G_06155 [Serratia liquefaciens]|uniref:hypothetical protein n=1 Tax=Serratia liquefaciens TaxID=614 RepID=UPI00381F417F